MELCWLLPSGEKSSPHIFVPAQKSRATRVYTQVFMNIKNWIIKSLCICWRPTMYQMLSVYSIYYHCQNPKKQMLGFLVYRGEHWDSENHIILPRVTLLSGFKVKICAPHVPVWILSLIFFHTIYYLHISIHYRSETQIMGMGL